MAAKEIKTVSDFNLLFRQFAKTVSLKPLYMRSIQSYTENVFRAIFGDEYVESIANNVLLGSQDVIIFEDTPPGTPGVKAIGFKKEQFDSITKDILDLQKDPTLKLSVQESQDLWIKLIGDRMARNKAINIEELKTEEEVIKNFFYSLSTPEGFSKLLKRIKNFIYEIKLAKFKGAWKTIVQAKDKLSHRYGSSFSILTWAGIYGTARSLWGKIPILLGPCPLKHINYIEVARSGKVLKFRATGSVFLALQEGGADAIRIEGVLYKAEFPFIMFMLWGLFLYGQSKFREIESIPSISQTADPTIIRKLNDIIMSNTDLERPTYEFHQTFPLVSRHFIIPNCFIETISIEDKLPLKDTLKYSVLIRTYEKPTEVTWMPDPKKGANNVYGFKNKTMMAKVCEYSLNAGWRLLNYSGWMIDGQEWKIRSAMEEGALDTYYDVDWSSLASVVYLNLIGAVT